MGRKRNDMRIRPKRMFTHVRKELDGIKVLGGGELTKKLTVQAAKFSGSAK